MKALCRIILMNCLTAVLVHGIAGAAAIHDRVVAFVDNQAITLSEFQEQLKNTARISPTVTEDEVLNAMINRILLIKEAKKYRIEASTKEEAIKEYVNLKIRAFLKVSDTEIEDFYQKNIQEFRGREYDEVRGEIENYLSEKILNEKLKTTLKELRKNAYIKIQLK
jgi:parvulin-like peptidyl-prolyl isomerase